MDQEKPDRNAAANLRQLPTLIRAVLANRSAGKSPARIRIGSWSIRRNVRPACLMAGRRPSSPLSPESALCARRRNALPTCPAIRSNLTTHWSRGCACIMWTKVRETVR